MLISSGACTIYTPLRFGVSFKLAAYFFLIARKG